MYKTAYGYCYTKIITFLRTILGDNCVTRSHCSVHNDCVHKTYRESIHLWRPIRPTGRESCWIAHFTAPFNIIRALCRQDSFAEIVGRVEILIARVPYGVSHWHCLSFFGHARFAHFELRQEKTKKRRSFLLYDRRTKPFCGHRGERVWDFVSLARRVYVFFRFKHEFIEERRREILRGLGQIRDPKKTPRARQIRSSVT